MRRDLNRERLEFARAPAKLNNLKKKKKKVAKSRMSSKIVAKKIKTENKNKKDKKQRKQKETEIEDKVETQLKENIEKAKTVFWSNLQTTKNNSLKASFNLPNLVKTFRVTVLAVNSEGVYGTYTAQMTVCKPFNMVVESPLFVRPNETVVCKMVLENNKDADITVDVVSLNQTIQIPKRDIYTLEFDVPQDQMPLNVEAIESGESHTHTVALPVYQGLTYEKSQNLKFQITDSKTTGLKKVLELPANMDPKSLRLKVEYKKLSANILVKGLKRLIREPYGCFEQTSATTFPLVMLIQYIDEQTQKSEKMLKMRMDAEEKMKSGIKRLLGYECKKGGFDWFGRDPGHPTLTAYGVWQFIEMNRISNFIDLKVIDRSLDWLRKKYQKSNAEFKMEGRGYDSFARPPQFCSDIYILFIMTLMDDYHINYKSIVSHKIADYESKKNASQKNSYLSSFVALIYLGGSSYLV